MIDKKRPLLFCFRLMFRLALAITVVLLLFCLSRSVLAAVGIDSHGKVLSAAQLKPLIVAAPRIHYPRLSRAVRSQGRGVYEMRIDLATGNVKDVVILKSAGARLLDIECVRALGHWRFQPGTVAIVREAIQFTLSNRATMPEYGY